jgi:hypothetical protein
MKNLKILRILLLAFVFSLAFLVVTHAAGTPQQVKYIYFENGSGQIVAVDFAYAIDLAIGGDSTLYNSIKNNMGVSVLFGRQIVLETSLGSILDYQKAVTASTPNLVDFQDNPTYFTTVPLFTHELKLVGGVATEVLATIIPAPAVTNNDTLNTVSGMAIGMEYALDGSGFIAYNEIAFNALNFSNIHTLMVRVASTPTSLPGYVTTLLFTTDPITPPAPAVTNDDTLNTVSGMAAGMEYSLDGAPYVAYDSVTFAAIDFGGNHTLLVRVAAEGINPFGPDTTLTFIGTPSEIAELAVSEYEATPLNTLAQVIYAESLKAAADSAVAAVLDPTQNAAFADRISARAAVIAAARLTFTITSIGAITGTGMVGNLLTSGAIAPAGATVSYQWQISDTSDGLYVDIAGATLSTYTPIAGQQNKFIHVVATGTGNFTGTVISEPRAILESAITAFNNAATASDIALLITNYATILGLNLTDYNALSDPDKVIVQTALLSPVFTTTAQIKTAFDNAVAGRKALLAVNTATAATMGSVITTYATALGLTTTAVTDYNALSVASKNIVHVALTDKSFPNAAAVNTAFVLAVSVPYINDATTTTNIEAGLRRYSTVLAFDAVAYTTYTQTSTNAASFRNRINTALLAVSMTTPADVQTAFKNQVDAAVLYTINIQLFNFMERDLKTYGVILGLNFTDYDLLLNKEPILTSMVATTFDTLNSIKTTFDSLVAQQKVIEAMPMVDAFNWAPDAATMGNVLAIYKTIFNTTNYGYYNNTIGTTAKTAVQNALISITFTSESDIKMGFIIALINNATATYGGMVMTNDSVLLGLSTATGNEFNTLVYAEKKVVNDAIIAAKPLVDQAELIVTAFNSTVTSSYVGALLTANSVLLGIDLTAYNSLSTADKTTVHNTLIAATLTNISDVKTTFDTAMAAF